MTLAQVLRTSTPLEGTSELEPVTLEPVSGKDAPASRPSGKTATQAKWEWLDRVMADVAAGRLSSTTFCVAFVIAQHINARTGDAWPKQTTIMRLAGASETTLRACIKALIDRGHLQQLKRGVRNGNKYRLRRGVDGIGQG